MFPQAQIVSCGQTLEGRVWPRETNYICVKMMFQVREDPFTPVPRGIAENIARGLKQMVGGPPTSEAHLLRDRRDYGT